MERHQLERRGGGRGGKALRVKLSALHSKDVRERVQYV